MGVQLTPRRVWAVGAVLVAVAATGACGGQSSGGTSPPACTWPAAFDGTDATTGACRAARYYLSCLGADGSGEHCPSDDPTRCSEPAATPGVTYSDCENQCGPDEYTLVCGAVGSGSGPQPPDTCRTLAPNPGGSVAACCACEPATE